MKAPHLQKQLLISVIVLIAVPLLFIMMFGNYFYAKGIDEQAKEYTAQMLEQVRMNVDASIGAVESVIGYLSVNERERTKRRLPAGKLRPGPGPGGPACVPCINNPSVWPGCCI